MKRSKEAQDFTVISLKVYTAFAEVLGGIADKAGVSLNELMGYLVSCLVKYADTSHQLDPVLRKAVDMFEDFEGWQYMTSIVAGHQKVVSKAAYIQGMRNFCLYFFKELEKVNESIVMVDAEHYPQCATYNVVEIFQHVVDVCFPKFAKVLKERCRLRGVSSYIEVLKDIVYETMEDDENDSYIKEMFVENDYDVFGKKIEIKKYVPHNRKNSWIESNRTMAKAVQATIPFEEDNV